MKMRSLLIAAAAFSAIAGAANAQSSTSNSVEAKITFVAPVTVAAGQEMRFGSFTIPTAAGGKVVLGTDGNSTATGGGVVEISTSAPQNATFTLGAPVNTNVSLAIVSESVASGYTLGTFTISPTSGCSGASLEDTFTFSSATCVLTVGATLDLPDTAVAGSVTVGSIKATLAYQ